MATWLEHVKFNFGGTIGTPAVETWSNTVRFKVAIDNSPTVGSRILTGPELDEALGLLNAPLQAWFNGAQTGISVQAKLTWAKLNMIRTNGKQFDAATHRIDTGIVAGGLPGPAPHWYQTLALTMRTGVPRGRAHSGRIFPPLIGYMPDGGSPYISNEAATVMAQNWATALDAFSAVIRDAQVDGPGIAVDCYPVIASPATNVGPDPGGALLRRVTGVVCDRVGDIQHRRNEQVPRLEGPTKVVAGA